MCLDNIILNTKYRFEKGNLFNVVNTFSILDESSQVDECLSSDPSPDWRSPQHLIPYRYSRKKWALPHPFPSPPWRRFEKWRSTTNFDLMFFTRLFISGTLLFITFPLAMKSEKRFHMHFRLSMFDASRMLGIFPNCSIQVKSWATGNQSVRKLCVKYGWRWTVSNKWKIIIRRNLLKEEDAPN